MSDNENIRFEMWHGSDGVSITEYDNSGDELTVRNEWWWTWAELFAELTGKTGWDPHVFSQ